MRYLLMLYADEKAGAAIPPADMAGYMGQMNAYKDMLSKAGAFVTAEPLGRTNRASTIRVQKGKLHVQHGPYAETREQLGGYYIIEASDMDEARRLAALCPAATWGAIEIRPIGADFERPAEAKRA
jgi:hypothetical protein